MLVHLVCIDSVDMIFQSIIERIIDIVFVLLLVYIAYLVQKYWGKSKANLFLEAAGISTKAVEHKYCRQHHKSGAAVNLCCVYWEPTLVMKTYY